MTLASFTLCCWPLKAILFYKIFLHVNSCLQKVGGPILYYWLAEHLITMLILFIFFPQRPHKYFFPKMAKKRFNAALVKYFIKKYAETDISVYSYIVLLNYIYLGENIHILGEKTKYRHIQKRLGQ